MPEATRAAGIAIQAAILARNGVTKGMVYSLGGLIHGRLNRLREVVVGPGAWFRVVGTVLAHAVVSCRVRLVPSR
jgi:hypothetical protein